MEREPRTHRQCDHKRWWNGGFETLGGQPLRKRRAVRERRSGAPAMRLVLPPEKALHCYRPPGIGMDCHQCPFSPHNGRFLRHRFSPKPTSDRNINQFTKKKSRCQRGGVRGVTNQKATTERTNPQAERCSKDEAAALRKNHVVRQLSDGPRVVRELSFASGSLATAGYRRPRQTGGPTKIERQLVQGFHQSIFHASPRCPMRRPHPVAYRHMGQEGIWNQKCWKSLRIR